MRREWLARSDEELLAECEVDRFRASGPGGQKRNKTESAVRLRHLPSGCSARAVESRSQHANRAVALARLRVALAVEVRQPVRLDAQKLAELQALASEPTPGARSRQGTDHLNAIGDLLDVLAEAQMNLAETAARIGVGSAALARVLKADDAVRRWVNQERARLELGPLR